MTLYSYAKKQKVKKRKKVLSIISFILILTGMCLLIWVLFPIISFELFYAPQFVNLNSPIPKENIIKNLGTEFSHLLILPQTDYTRASTWFPKAVNIKLAVSASSYTLSIPKLKIDQAVVQVGGEDLSKSLIHFTGPLPGTYGNPVIFGHSTLPFLYNPKDYKTIFTKLPELKRGDDIFVTTDNVTYRYKVSDMHIIMPDDVSVLEQYYDSSYLTLITCVPPGTYLKRLIVKAQLEKM